MTTPDKERLAQWAGLECRCRTTAYSEYEEPVPWWTDCPRHANDGNPPDYSRDEVAVGLLQTLAAKGYWIILEYDATAFGTVWFCKIGQYSKPRVPTSVGYAEKPTIAEAITSAILAMLDKEEL